MRTPIIALALTTALAAPGFAADLGGNCCADLEERIAELEATTARKGNRKMSLEVSGQVHQALLWHDIDGLKGSDGPVVVDGATSGTRFRFKGSAKINPNMTAGFLLEIGVDHSKGSAGLASGGGLIIGGAGLAIRHSAVWMQTGVGTVTVGHTSTATDGVTEVDLSNSNVASLLGSPLEPVWTFLGSPAFGGGGINFSLSPTQMDGSRMATVRYDSPTMAGFTVHGAWAGGESETGDNVWDVALRYAGEFGGIRVAAGLGYRVNEFDTLAIAVFDESRTASGSASVMHLPSGLFLTGMYGHQEWGDIVTIKQWQLRGGIEKNFFGPGATTLFLEYGDHDLSFTGVPGSVSSHFWGAGVVQRIDAAAMDIYVNMKQLEIGDGALDAVVGTAGARIQF